VTSKIKLFAAGLELTTACCCRCDTCGSAAGSPRPQELSTAEWQEQVRALARLGCQRLSLLGGEPLLYPGWLAIAELATGLGLIVDLITCGLGIDEVTLEALSSGAFASITLSIDGTEAVHDRLRRTPGGYAEALRAITRLDRAGMKVGVTTQVNQSTLPTLLELAPELQEAGAMGWQLQLTMPSGRARQHRDLVLRPADMPRVHEALRQLVARRGLRPFITDNIGYLTRDDPILRTPPMHPPRTYCGCFAGLRAIGITSDGGVKGCLALPDELVEGNVRQQPLEEIWLDEGKFSYNRAFDPASLSASCAACAYAQVCRGGCTAMSLAAAERPNQGTYCFRLQGVC
jgi:radical SAM protein with 4Fe4S-binding SPASM domain